MRKIAIFFLIVLAIIVAIVCMYMDYQNKQEKLNKYNYEYEYYLQKEINGLQLASVMNKAIDTNNKNDITQDEKGKFIENDEDSIKIDIKMLDNDKTYDMETIYINQISVFTSYYGDIQFKCTAINYHEKTGKVKYLLFEQITT